jgi:hypothetical protein
MNLTNFLLLHKRLDIKRSDIVLDIGSGEYPLPRADILVDKYVYSDLERGYAITVDRPFICADGEYLPFKDKSIDFIYCNQLLEHIVRPETFLKELERAGKRGVIITPDGDFDKVFSNDRHLWYVWNKERKLLLQQKKAGHEYPEISASLAKVRSARDFWKHYFRNFYLYNTVYYWKGKIDYRIKRYGEFDFSKFKKGFGEDVSSKTVLSKTPRYRIRSSMGKIIRTIYSSSFDINDLICCPRCKGELSELNKKVERLECRKCGEIYKVENGIPFMDIGNNPGIPFNRG